MTLGQYIGPLTEDADDLRKIIARSLGTSPPSGPVSGSRWVSRSHKHLEAGVGRTTRTPIVGSAAVGGLPAQEFSPYYNPLTARYEALVSISSGGLAQYFTYASDPFGPWATPVKVLGLGSGGESGNAQQASVYVEGGKLWVTYTTGSALIVLLASADLPANPGDVPAFTKLGTVWTDTVSTTGSCYIIKVSGLYYMFIERGSPGPMKIATSPASDPSGFVAQPFTTVVSSLTLTISAGVRNINGFGRPFVVNENGLWVLYAHGGNALEFGYCHIYRWTSTDVGTPTNWTADKKRPFLRQLHQLEVDQTVDFRACQGPNGNWTAFWTAARNINAVFTILAAPMMEPELMYADGTWQKAWEQSDPLADPGFITPDTLLGNTNLQHLWDGFFDTTAGDALARLPPAASRSVVRITNAPTTRSTAGRVTLRTDAGDETISSGNPVTAMSAVGTTVTVTTKRRHNLIVGDAVTITGATPTTYNINAVAVASVPTDTSFTYVAGSAPAANTVLGCYEVALDPGECRTYRCRIPKNWVRG